MFDLPATRVRYIQEQFGDEGRRWLGALPGQLETLSRRWDVKPVASMDAGLLLNFIFEVRSAGVPAVLKIGYPHPEQQTEITVLEAWRSAAQVSCVRLLRADRKAGAVLLERVGEGRQFRGTGAPVDQLKTLFETVPLPAAGQPDLPTFDDWLHRAQHSLSAAGQSFSHLDRAVELYGAMPGATSEDRWLLHGDLHHENILAGEAGWTAIDPKGVLGPRVMEYGRFLHNFLADETGDQASIEDVLRQRAGLLAGEFTADELLVAGYIDLSLSLSWTLIEGAASSEVPTLNYVDVLDLLADMVRLPGH